MADRLKNADEALREQDEVAILTTGISMRPMLREHKDIVIVERLKRPLKNNDVPLYRRAGVDRFILHRIVKCKGDKFVIRGDNLYFNEYDVKPTDIIGVLKAFIRNGKYIDCQTHFGYKLYVLWIRASYPFRFFWYRILKPILSKIKRFILGKHR